MHNETSPLCSNLKFRFYLNLTMANEQLIKIHLILLLLLSWFFKSSFAFLKPLSKQQYSLLSATTTKQEQDKFKSDVLVAIEPTQRGLSTNSKQRIDIETKIRALEDVCPIVEPARDARMAGRWKVLYTTAPPPSNGQLGPFVGVAKQEIDLENNSYKNILEVGDNSWLSAVLQATWAEWNGELLEEKNAKGNEEWKSGVVEVEDDDNVENDYAIANNGSNVKSVKPSPFESLLSIFGGETKKKDERRSVVDYGATSWKVDFKSITISFFGIPLLKNTFPDDTARVWKMTCKLFSVLYFIFWFVREVAPNKMLL